MDHEKTYRAKHQGRRTKCFIQDFLFLWTTSSPVPCTGCQFGLEHIFPLSFTLKELSPSTPRWFLNANQSTVECGQLGYSLPKHTPDPTKPHVDASTWGLSWLHAAPTAHLQQPPLGEHHHGYEDPGSKARRTENQREQTEDEEMTFPCKDKVACRDPMAKAAPSHVQC